MDLKNTFFHQVSQRFQTHFQAQPELIVRGPGRINLIGEHTDYNGGFVLPASIDKEIIFAISKKEGTTCEVYAENVGDSTTFSLDQLEKSRKGWPNYLMGVVDQLQKRGCKLGGFRLVFGGDIPTGAGLSSSAAIECGLAFCLNELYALGLSKIEMVKLSQAAENQFVGVQCGIMDQFASMMGKANSVIQLDCRSLEYQYFPLELNDYLVVLCDTAVKHSLGNSEYNTRRQECEAGVDILQRKYPEVQLLRDATPAMVETCRDEMPAKVYDRCRYMTEEIERVQLACQLLLANDLEGFGQKMYETHDGLQHLYEVSCPELDFLVDQTRSDDNVLGSRMMGGGFGGCTINIVRKDAVDAFEQKLAQAYHEAFGIDLKCYRVTITDGTEAITA
ncbi:galactokinase [Tellurirhabdus bombi]|uniref:galactokinase n=1 Tax=Tellurirhabdus bombi TaxID=2907205 RepID=UPI001F1CDD0D|nr:galactokinase [Tellurirhabdus bombi]